jgi:hypothetical protein
MYWKRYETVYDSDITNVLATHDWMEVVSDEPVITDLDSWKEFYERYD